LTGFQSNFSPKRTIFQVDFGRLATEGQLNHRDFWSGRWESNPTPNAAKSLIPLIYNSGLASNSVQFQFRRYFFDSFPMRVSDDMPVNFKRCARVGVTELPLHDFWCSA
jgi:hypothetical protein